MGITKKELFTPRQNELARIAKALGHPARIAILDHLRKANQCINGDLVEVIGLAQSTISQHLKELKAAGIVRGTVEGSSVCYCIDPKTWDQYGHELKAFFSPLASIGEDCC